MFFASGLAGGWFGGRLVSAPAAPAVVAASPCAQAQFVSPAFGYCVDVPEGWEVSRAAAEPTGSDLFRHEQASLELLVQAVSLPDGIDLESAATSMRAEESMEGLSVTELSTGSLGGEAALIWQTFDGNRLVAHEIVVARDGVVWRLQVAPAGGRRAAAFSPVEDLLGTWRFA